LRERPEDIRPLAEHFLRESAPACTFSTEAFEALERYTWPGNVRELRNAVVAAGVLASAAEIALVDLPAEIHARVRGPDMPTPTRLKQMEQQMIIEALAKTGGSPQSAAAMLGVSKRTISRKLKRYGMANAHCKSA
jgi:DNA-binding NtrC family response regulator